MPAAMQITGMIALSYPREKAAVSTRTSPSCSWACKATASLKIALYALQFANVLKP
jgi:hypothetical protein